MPTTSLIESLKDLGDEDVKLLYEVAFLAQQSSNLPIRALYDAYDQVLPQFGTDTQHDDRCFRWLSHARMELAKDGTRGILKRYRALLALADIQVGHEGDEGISEIALSEVQDDGGTEPSTLPPRQDKRRRASFNDSNLDTTWISGDRPHQLVDEARPSHGATRETHTNRKSRIRSASIDRDVEEQHVLAAPDVWTQPANVQQLEADAEYMYFTKVGRRFLWLWHARATQTHRRQQDLLQMATNHDRRTLLKQSFSSMRDNAFTSKFRKQQERRITRVRDYFLLTKAFTHWAQAASDQVVRTNVAKRHILRTRYFNAWRDITTVNELKCRMLGLRKWFGLWRSRAETITTDDEVATLYRERHLLRRFYRQWFFRICEQKAPMWKDGRLEVKYFQAWKSRSEIAQSMALAAAGHHNTSLMKSKLALLRARNALTQDLVVLSINLRRRSLQTAHLRLWRRNTTFKPSEARAVAAKDGRLVAKAFRTWRTATGLSYQAREVDRRRLLANALTTWNDQLRSKTLVLKINERVQLQALYKWVLDERLILFRRVMEHRQKTDAVRRISTRIAARQFELDEATQILHHNKDTRLAQLTLVKMHAIMRQREQNELAAIEFRNARILPRCFQIWTTQSSHARQLSRWASQARFYCLTTMAVKKWKRATTEQQKVRRREAYATIRKRHKASLARHCLAKLHEKASTMVAHRFEAQHFQTQEAEHALRQHFERWHVKTTQWRADEREANRINTRSHLVEVFAAFRDKLDAIGERTADAVMFEQLARERLAAKMLRKLSDTVFVLQRTADTASAWKDRKFVQHQREMLRHWAMQANGRRTMRDAGDPDSPSKTPTMRASKMSKSRGRAGDSILGLNDVSRAEQWTRFDDLGEQLDGVDQSAMSFGATPLPGYLRTPSRRTARSRARFRTVQEQPGSRQTRTIDSRTMDFGSSVVGSTTPAPLAPGQLEDMETLTPQVTPFQRKMRAGGYQNSTTPLTAPTIGLAGMSAFASSSRFQGTGRTVRFDEAADDDESIGSSRPDGSPSKGA
ncbi:Sfi1 spindle body protein-domain-containing protein [Elsinoe ampelina]|uniref:Sfi1 spindle body protein-domain-containing protein n=1 Tax=Elsinoe ampelina TaxID=302913 RepID=A0A6A6GPI3_9PEZI|nr:Sfi1 spindle body protein-domain-containing protein [Elsinoe ampelina]